MWSVDLLLAVTKGARGPKKGQKASLAHSKPSMKNSLHAVEEQETKKCLAFPKGTEGVAGVHPR